MTIFWFLPCCCTFSSVLAWKDLGEKCVNTSKSRWKATLDHNFMWAIKKSALIRPHCASKEDFVASAWCQHRNLFFTERKRTTYSSVSLWMICSWRLAVHGSEACHICWSLRFMVCACVRACTAKGDEGSRGRQRMQSLKMSTKPLQQGIALICTQCMRVQQFLICLE